MFIATWCAWPTSGRNFLGVSRLITFVSWSAWTRLARLAGSDQHPAFHDRDGPEVAVPPLDRVLLDEAVASEQLDTVQTDLHALVRAEPPGEGDVSGDVPSGGGTGGRLPGQQPHGLELDRDVGDHERHRL